MVPYPLYNRKTTDMWTEKEHLHKAIWKRWQILIFAKECHQYAWYFWGDTDKSKDEIEYMQSSKHLQFIRECVFQRYIVELVKLVSQETSNNHYTFAEFFSLARKQRIPNCGIDENQIIDWERRLHIHLPIIETIKILRHKQYAHTDADFDTATLKTEVSFLKLRELLECLESIIADVYSLELESDIQVETPFFSSRKIDILTVLAADWKAR